MGTTKRAREREEHSAKGIVTRGRERAGEEENQGRSASAVF